MCHPRVRVSRLLGLAACLLSSLLVTLGCAPSDPLEAALAERAAWNVTVDRWLQGDDGGLFISARANGPVHAKLATLTVRIELLDAAGGLIREDWRELDLSGFSRGETKEVMLRLPAVDASVEGLKLDPMPDPTPDQQARMSELQGL